MTLIFDILAAFVGVAMATALCVVLMRNKSFRRRHAGTLAAGAFLLGLGHVYAGGQAEMVQESKDETKRKKDAQSGDPPTSTDRPGAINK